MAGCREFAPGRAHRQSDLTAHAGALKPLEVNARNAPLNPAPAVPLQISAGAAPVVLVNNPVAIARDKSAAKTRLSRQEHRDDAPEQAKNPNGDSADCGPLTCTNGCPVSMVTGEELLTLNDGSLNGFCRSRSPGCTAPAPWKSIAGWAGAGVIRWRIAWSWTAEHVVWIDHENRRTTFPLPSAERPAIHNSLSRAAIYLGDQPEELVLALAGETARFYHFRNGRLTAISDAYNNRLHITRDRQDRIQRLDNGAGRSLLLRYERRHIVAVEYQRFTPPTRGRRLAHRANADCLPLRRPTSTDRSDQCRRRKRTVRLRRPTRDSAAATGRWGKFLLGVGTVRQSRAMHSALGVVCADGYALCLGRQRRVLVKNVDGSEEVYVHDDQARLVRRVEPDGGEHLKAYDDKGQLIAEQDPLGAITQYRYDEIGRLVALIPPEDEPTSYEYRNGFLHARYRGKAVWKYQRNAQGDVTEATDPDGQITHYHYDEQGQLLSIRYPDNSRHVFVRDAWGN